MKPFIIIFLVLIGIFSCIDPIYPKQMFLQHFATIIIILFLIYDSKVNFLSLTAFIGISIFVLLHIVGARYIYSFVPYNDWTVSIFGLDLNSYFGFERNHYDRLVHLLFGLLVFPFTFELMIKKYNMSFKASILIAFLCIQTYSMIYEIFEWMLTILVSNEEAENYNGQQGDNWDAHKDMTLAMIGSLVAVIYTLFRKKKIVQTLLKS